MIEAPTQMKVRPWDREADYPLLKAWFEGNGSLGPHPSQLPPLGVVVEEDGEPIAAVGAYQSLGVGVAFPEWLITNPEIKPRKKLKAVITVMDALERMLVADGYDMHRAAIIDDRIANLAQKHLGFRDIGPKVNYLVKSTV
jgi:hypothetical protein